MHRARAYFVGNAEETDLVFEIFSNIDDAIECSQNRWVNPDGLLWKDMRELESAELQVLLTEKIGIDAAIQVMEEIAAMVSPTLRGIQGRLDTKQRLIMSDVEGDLNNFAINTLLGFPSCFFKDMEQVYRCGYWPCSCKVSGNRVVFSAYRGSDEQKK